MFEFLRQAITAHTYTDLTAMTAKVEKAWAFSAITDDERAELLSMLRAEQPCYDMDVRDEIARIWAAVHSIENRLTTAPSEDVDEPDIPDWVQPTGAHDAYNEGDKVRYNGAVYVSTINGNVWSPEVYPAGWNVVE